MGDRVVMYTGDNHEELADDIVSFVDAGGAVRVVYRDVWSEICHDMSDLLRIWDTPPSWHVPNQESLALPQMVLAVTSDRFTLQGVYLEADVTPDWLAEYLAICSDNLRHSSCNVEYISPAALSTF